MVHFAKALPEIYHISITLCCDWWQQEVVGMSRPLVTTAVAGAVLLSAAAQAQTTPEGYQLQRVLMMSRHNLHAPLINNGNVLEQSAPKQ